VILLHVFAHKGKQTAARGKQHPGAETGRENGSAAAERRGGLPLQLSRGCAPLFRLRPRRCGAAKDDLLFLMYTDPIVPHWNDAPVTPEAQTPPWRAARRWMHMSMAIISVPRRANPWRSGGSSHRHPYPRCRHGRAVLGERIRGGLPPIPAAVAVQKNLKVIATTRN
jgi:hypothetical protein